MESGGGDSFLNQSVRIVNGYTAEARGFMVLLRLNDLVPILPKATYINWFTNICNMHILYFCYF
jgi:hypothetical protein